MPFRPVDNNPNSAPRGFRPLEQPSPMPTIDVNDPKIDQKNLLTYVGNSPEQAERITALANKYDMADKVQVGGIGGLPAYFKAAPAAIRTAGGFFSGSAVPAAISATGHGISGIGKKIADVAMQIATGRKKFTPEAGNILADEGIVGTTSMMKNQVENKLAQRGAQLEEAASKVPGAPIDNAVMAERIAESPLGKTGQVPGAKPSASDKPDMREISRYLKDISSRGQETASQALRRRSTAGQRGYNAQGNPLKSLEGKLAKAEQQQVSEQLKQASPEISKIDPIYAALKKGQAGLESPVSLPTSVMGALSTPVKALPLGSLGASLLGQVAQKSSNAISKITPELELAAILSAANKKKE